ncbi:MAG TPA: DUF4153 domain-containing protein [Flavipsychrobacter sp.]|nr:DUF4153 domain-containing protein [Flavipsychrobacter sp.]
MRFPSFRLIVDKTLKVATDYPIECITSVAGTVAAIQLSYQSTDKQWEQLLLRIVMTAALALPSFLAVTIRSRFRRLAAQQKYLEYGVIAMILVIFFFSMDDSIKTKDVLRFFMLNTLAHLMVSCAGFINRGSTHAFWQFNKELFLRIVTAAIFSGVLFAGLAGALTALNELFGLHMNGAWYFRLFATIAGIFNTWFFLSSVPQEAGELERDTDYPKVLKVFTQFVLVPLVTIYLIILLAYEAKIIIQWKLPQGWVSHLILAYGVAGILSILLVFPIRSTEGNHWIKAFAKWFYVLLLPLVALMFVAIGKRIGVYGFTEERLIVLLLAIWLAAISVFYLLRPNGDIRIIPLSLATVALLLSFSAFKISEASQRSRLKSLLIKNGMLVNHKATPLKEGKKISFADKKNISSVLYYLLENHGNSSVEPWFKTDNLEKKEYSAYTDAAKLVKSLNIEYVDNYTREEDSTARYQWLNYNAKREALSIAGYEYMIGMEDYMPINLEDHSPAGFTVYKTWRDSVKIALGKDTIAAFDPHTLLNVLIKKYGSSLSSDQQLPRTEMKQMIATDSWDITVYYNRISGSMDTFRSDGTLNFSGFILLKKK